ncbi:MAG: hypothetical protein UU93_C0002G0020 [Candidatus Amesbacteria bacterium GW2011_GWA2_42_12]|uniref:Uncharacterized protein n=1 Tax=Candidatus Amesbacteria bacterium GW2011_GWA2_42_12 TaxID=1618356 RepID=A0A0G0Y8P9_9BACT|nr:MAG: hypothetical protein UU93_C0002G0020 [Candidatus Amesbacteria bacterium GW2011_GWA2_42_12]
MAFFLRIVLAVFIYVLVTFVMWRKMRTDYEPEDILNLSLIVAIMSVVSSKWGILAGVVGGFITLLVWCRFKKWDFWEWLDILGLWGLLALIITFNWKVVLIAILGMLVLGLISRSYRSWRWYRSGKVGIVGLASLLVWSGASIVGTSKLASVPVYSAVLVALASLVTIYIRSGLWRKNK